MLSDTAHELISIFMFNYLVKWASATFGWRVIVDVIKIGRKGELSGDNPIEIFFI